MSDFETVSVAAAQPSHDVVRQAERAAKRARGEFAQLLEAAHVYLGALREWAFRRDAGEPALAFLRLFEQLPIGELGERLLRWRELESQARDLSRRFYGELEL